MNIYFAGSIRGGRDDQESYFKIIEMLKEYGTVLTEQVGSKSLNSDGEDLSSSEIFYRNLTLLQEADVIVAEVSTPSLDVGFEIGLMTREKPILCLFRREEGKRLSAMIEGNIRITTRIYQSIEEFQDILSSFFAFI